MSKNLSMRNDFGEVEITEELAHAITMIREAAWTLQVTPGEFMEFFVDGIPECPCCKAEAENGH